MTTIRLCHGILNESTYVSCKKGWPSAYWVSLAARFKGKNFAVSFRLGSTGKDAVLSNASYGNLVSSVSSPVLAIVKVNEGSVNCSV